MPLGTHRSRPIVRRHSKPASPSPPPTPPRNQETSCPVRLLPSRKSTALPDIAPVCSSRSSTVGYACTRLCGPAHSRGEALRAVKGARWAGDSKARRSQAEGSRCCPLPRGYHSKTAALLVESARVCVWDFGSTCGLASVALSKATQR